MHFTVMSRRLKFPKKEQSIRINTINGVEVECYITEICKIIHPSSIIFHSWINDNSLGFYLEKKELVDELIMHNAQIVVNNIKIQIQRLCDPDEKIILSNVFPHIPDKLILKELKNYEILPTSAISLVKASLTSQRFSHIYSFKREMTISPSDVKKLPESIVIRYRGLDCKISLSIDTATGYQNNNNNQTNMFNSHPKSGNINQDKTIQSTQSAVDINPLSENVDDPMTVDNEEIFIDVTNPHTVDISILNGGRKIPAPYMETYVSHYESGNISNSNGINIGDFVETTHSIIRADQPIMSAPDNIDIIPFLSSDVDHSEIVVDNDETQSLVLCTTSTSQKFSVKNTNNHSFKNNLNNSILIPLHYNIEFLWPARNIFVTIPNAPLTFDQFVKLIDNCMNNPHNIIVECERYNINRVMLLRLIDIVIQEDTLSLRTKNSLKKFHTMIFTSLTGY